MADIKNRTVIGQSEYVDIVDLGLTRVPARIDTGARTSAIWASDIKEENGELRFKLFGQDSEFYTGKELVFKDYEMREVTPSNGITEERYMIKVRVKLSDRKIMSRITLANRSTQKYPVLIGRNVLRGKYIVDIKHNYIRP